MHVRFIDNIGNGGFGNVDKVQDQSGLFFARKTFSINQPPGFPQNLEENVKKRFIREAQMQSGITHRNIVPVIYHDLISDPPLFMMPLALGTLADDIAMDKTLSGNYLSAVMDIIAGLEEIHSMGIFHRDLKPQNVLKFPVPVDQKNDRDHYYAIGDFGLMSVHDTRLSVLTQTGMRMRSDYYTAPEIVKDLRRATAQSDIFSLGCILHDFVGTDDRIPCHEINEPGDYGAIIRNCTRKDPKRRFRSVASVRDAILSLGEQEVTVTSARGIRAEQLLLSDNGLDENSWREVVNFIEDESENDDGKALLAKFSLEKIREVAENFPDLARVLGLCYARWVRDGAFSFSTCDGIANRLQEFILHSPIEVQAECLMAMLYMGTSHNRWYVERKFASLAGASMTPDLARRLSVEFRADGERACWAISHWERSISADRKDLHPLLVGTLSAVC